MNSKAARLVLVLGAVCLVFVLTLNAQVQTQTNTTSQAPSSKTTVERGTIVYVSGNDLVIKMEDGTLRHFNNVPDSARATVDGKEIGIRDAKVGMKLEKTVTVTTTPKTVTTVQSVTGKVWQIMPPTSVILTLEDGSNQQFKIPKNQKFNIDGQMVDAWGLKKGMRVSATKIVEVPETIVEHEQKLTGSAPAPPPPPPADQPILVVEQKAVPVEVAQAAPAPAALPKTASPVPLFGLLGLLSLASSLGLRTARKSR